MKEEIPSGPKPSIIVPSQNFHKNKPSFFEDLINNTSYNSSKYHLLTKKLYKGLFIDAIALGSPLFLTNE
jgi:hypothetical protein